MPHIASSPALLPTAFADSVPALRGLIARHRPVLVLALGQAGGRAEISLERIAINLIDARIADNSGAQPIDVAVVENAPNAYFSTLPIKAMLARLHGAQISSRAVAQRGHVCLQSGVLRSDAPARHAASRHARRLCACTVFAAAGSAPCRCAGHGAGNHARCDAAMSGHRVDRATRCAFCRRQYLLSRVVRQQVRQQQPASDRPAAASCRRDR